MWCLLIFSCFRPCLSQSVSAGQHLDSPCLLLGWDTDWINDAKTTRVLLTVCFLNASKKWMHFLCLFHERERQTDSSWKHKLLYFSYKSSHTWCLPLLKKKIPPHILFAVCWDSVCYFFCHGSCTQRGAEGGRRVGGKTHLALKLKIICLIWCRPSWNWAESHLQVRATDGCERETQRRRRSIPHSALAEVLKLSRWFHGTGELLSVLAALYSN